MFSESFFEVQCFQYEKIIRSKTESIKYLLTRFARKSTIGKNSGIKNDCNFKKGTFLVGDMNSALGRSSKRIGKFAIFSNVRTAKQSAY